MKNDYGFLKGLLRAFTLAEVLIAIAIVGVIAGLVLPTTISRAQNRGFEQSYSRNVQTMEDAVNTLIVSENKDFFKSVMYSDTTPSSYDNTSGTFIKKYLKVSRYCGSGTDNAKLCFPSTYFRYNGNSKEIYNPNFAGACAKLKNGASICLQPQIGATGAKGIIDLNGPSGPNVLNRDLRTFELMAKTNSAKDRTQDNVAVTLAPDLDSYEDPCTRDPNGRDCCLSKSTPTAACCTNFPADFGTHPACIVTPPPPTDPCATDPNSLACCQKQGVTDSNKNICCAYAAIKSGINSRTHKCCTVSSVASTVGACSMCPSGQKYVAGWGKAGDDGPPIYREWCVEYIGQGPWATKKSECESKGMRLPTMHETRDLTCFYSAMRNTPGYYQDAVWWTSEEGNLYQFGSFFRTSITARILLIHTGECLNHWGEEYKTVPRHGYCIGPLQP